MSKATRAVLVAALIAVAGCAPSEDQFGAAEAGYVENAARYVQGVDWTGAETVTVNLTSYAFTPAKLTFQEGKPYRLVLENAAGTEHTFTSEGFFRAIAAESLETPTGVVNSPYLESIVLQPGETKKLLFVPVRKGTYELECTEPLHATFGMEGIIEIV